MGHATRTHRIPISAFEKRIVQGAEEARDLLRNLERALVSCGYTRDGTYNSRSADFTDRREAPTIIRWRSGEIVLLKNNESPCHIDDMTAYDLIDIATHLAPFLDLLENGSRHLAQAIEHACEVARAVTESIKADPRPA